MRRSNCALPNRIWKGVLNMPAIAKLQRSCVLLGLIVGIVLGGVVGAGMTIHVFDAKFNCRVKR